MIDWKVYFYYDESSKSVGLFHENTTLDGKKACAVLVVDNDVPNVLKYAKLWKPKEVV